MPIGVAEAQKILENARDYDLQQLISRQDPSIPQFLILAEINRRQQIRDIQNLGRSRPTTIRQEMSAGQYRPVPPPSIGIVSPQLGAPVTQPTIPQGPTPPRSPRGITSLMK